MAARETKPNGKSQLIRDLKNGEFATLYIISGETSGHEGILSAAAAAEGGGRDLCGFQSY